MYFSPTLTGSRGPAEAWLRTEAEGPHTVLLPDAEDVALLCHVSAEGWLRVLRLGPVLTSPEPLTAKIFPLLFGLNPGPGRYPKDAGMHPFMTITECTVPQLGVWSQETP